MELDFPSQPPQMETLPPAAITALGIHPLAVMRSGNKVLIDVAKESEVRSIHPDFAALLHATKYEIIVTSQADMPGFDFVSRFFAPVVGINEDPVTGSAHCVLTPYWGQKLDKFEMKAFQASERGGILKVRLAGDRVFILGQAVTISEGEIIE